MLNFINPFLLGLLAFLPLIVVMYLLKLKRKQVTLPSILLWKKTLEDMIANRPFQRLRNNILLWIQLLIMALLALAAARPFLNMAGYDGDAIVLVIDNSASMQATDILPSRLDYARAEALRLIGDLSHGDRMMLLTLNSSSQVAQPLTSDKDLLRRALRSIEPTDMASDADEAVRIIESVMASESNLQVILLSDGRISNVDRLLELEDLRGRLKFLTVGEDGENAGFTQLDVRPNYEQAGTYEIFASLENFGAGPVTQLVEFYFNEQLSDAREVAMSPGSVQSIVFNTSAEGGTFRLKLPAKDILAVDNEVIGAIQPQTAFRVLVVGQRNPFLESAFRAHPLVALSTATLADYNPAADFDLVVFDSVSPEGPLAQGNYLFLNSVPPIDGFGAAAEDLEYPVIVDWNPVHPVTRFIKFDNIVINKAMKLVTPPQTSILAEAQQGVMMAFVQRPDLSVIVIPFDVLNSSWPLLPSFPMFVNNVIDWLAQMRLSRGKLMAQTGGSLPLRIPETWTAAEIVRPDGSRGDVAITPGQVLYFAGTERAGTYLLKEKGGASAGAFRFAVNLVSTKESDVAPAPSLETPRVSVAGIKGLEPMNREIWKWLVLAGLAFLILEWFIYCRRSWV